MSDCLFCKIAAGDIPSNKVYEDGLCYAFNDIAPQAPHPFEPQAGNAIFSGWVKGRDISFSKRDIPPLLRIPPHGAGEKGSVIDREKESSPLRPLHRRSGGSSR